MRKALAFSFQCQTSKSMRDFYILWSAGGFQEPPHVKFKENDVTRWSRRVRALHLYLSSLPTKTKQWRYSILSFYYWWKDFFVFKITHILRRRLHSLVACAFVASLLFLPLLPSYCYIPFPCFISFFSFESHNMLHWLFTHIHSHHHIVSFRAALNFSYRFSPHLLTR